MDDVIFYLLSETAPVDFDFQNYLDMAEFIRSAKGKVMVSTYDRPDIRRVLDGLSLLKPDIKHSMAKNHGATSISGELVIRTGIARRQVGFSNYR